MLYSETVLRLDQMS